MIDSIKSAGTDVYCVKERSSRNMTQSKFCNYLMLSHGHIPSEQRKFSSGGLSIILSRNSQRSWKRAGQPEPVRADILTHIARIIGIKLYF